MLALALEAAEKHAELVEGAWWPTAVTARAGDAASHIKRIDLKSYSCDKFEKKRHLKSVCQSVRSK